MLLENFNVLDVLLFLQEELRKIPDFSRLAKKFQRQKASLQVIYSTINNIWLICKEISCSEGSFITILSNIKVVPLAWETQSYGFK